MALFIKETKLAVKLVRHGETDWNFENRIQGHKRVGLSKRGVLQSEEVAELLKSTKIDEIYSSDLKRSVQTAEIINQRFGLPIIQLPGLREMDYGDWEGKLWSDVYDANPNLNNSWESLGAKFFAPGGETALGFRSRVIDTFKNIVLNSIAENILIVTHAQVIKMIMTCFREVNGSGIFTFIKLKNCCIETIDAERLEDFRRKMAVRHNYV